MGTGGGRACVVRQSDVGGRHQQVRQEQSAVRKVGATQVQADQGAARAGATEAPANMDRGADGIGRGAAAKGREEGCVRLHAGWEARSHWTSRALA